MSGSGYAGVSSYVNNVAYRAFGVKQMANANGRTLSVQYDNRMRVTRWDVPGVMGWNYSYNNFNENTGRATYAQNLYDATLDRSYDYDNVGRLIEAHTGSEARGALIGQGGAQDGPYSHSYRYDQFGNPWYRVGWGGSHGAWLEEWPTYTNNRRNGLQYDAAGNLTNDGYQSYTYDATGQQTYASGTALAQAYDGDRLRVKKTENTSTTYYLRSTVLGGQIVADLNSGGTWTRGYVYLGGQMLAIQSNGVNWVHQDPVTKSQRVTNSSGTVTSTVDLDPWGGETSRSSNQAFQPHRYTTYERDGNGGDEAMMRRYTAKWQRFNQPDPYDGSYSLTDPQSFNRYAYVQNDPVNFVDPTGLDGEFTCDPEDPMCVVGSVTIHDGGNTSGGGASEWGGFDRLAVVSDFSKDLTLALEKLQKENCRKLFGDWVDPTALLTKIAKGDTTLGSLTKGDLGAPKGGLVDAAVTVGILGTRWALGGHAGPQLIRQSAFIGATITINSNARAPFQTGYNDYLRVGATDAIYRALTLIHELGHAARRIYGAEASRILDDGNNPSQSRANSRLVYDNCFR